MDMWSQWQVGLYLVTSSCCYGERVMMEEECDVHELVTPVGILGNSSLVDERRVFRDFFGWHTSPVSS